MVSFVIPLLILVDYYIEIAHEIQDNHGWLWYILICKSLKGACGGHWPLLGVSLSMTCVPNYHWVNTSIRNHSVLAHLSKSAAYSMNWSNCGVQNLVGFFFRMFFCNKLDSKTPQMWSRTTWNNSIWKELAYLYSEVNRLITWFMAYHNFPE